ncbi:MAG: Hsp20/alpha crystallin family protein [Deltaproteobacteria bacterium]|nr:Hsp20/alpha crystallin family protein [Deltaproteobacteria bacterium]
MSEKNDRKEIAVREKEAVVKDKGEPTRSGIAYSPAVDIFETDAGLTVLADLPGVDRDHLEVDVRDGVLTVEGRVSEPEARFKPVYSEYGIGGYSRRFSLGNDIDASKIEAELKDGVLRLVLPKTERLKPRKVEVKTS